MFTSVDMCQGLIPIALTSQFWGSAVGRNVLGGLPD